MSDKKQNMVQTSVRLPSETLAAIKAMSDSSKVPQSEVIRAAITLYQSAGNLTYPQKLAVVDISKSKPGGFYYVDQYVINESSE